MVYFGTRGWLYKATSARVLSSSFLFLKWGKEEETTRKLYLCRCFIQKSQKVFWMKTSACRDGTTDNIFKKTAKQYGMTPEQMLRGKNRGKWKGWQPLGVELRTPLAWAAMQCSATELQQPDNQQTPQSSICSYYIHFPLFSPHNIYFQHEARCSGHHNTFTPSLHFVPFFQLCMFTVCWQLQFPSLAT